MKKITTLLSVTLIFQFFANSYHVEIIKSYNTPGAFTSGVTFDGKNLYQAKPAEI